MHSPATSIPIWLPYVTQEPNESSLTLRPDLPRRRYFMGIGGHANGCRSRVESRPRIVPIRYPDAPLPPRRHPPPREAQASSFRWSTLGDPPHRYADARSAAPPPEL